MNQQSSLDFSGAEPKTRDELCIWFDGASRGNGQPGARASIGGVVKDSGTTELLAEVSRCIGEETNNVAEYMALLETIEVANRFPARRIVIRGDSALVINQLRGAWKVKAQHLLPLLRSVRAALSRYEAVEFVHVMRDKNLEADALANAALDGEG